MWLAVISRPGLSSFIKHELKSIKRGESRFESAHVEQCSLSAGQLVGLPHWQSVLVCVFFLGGCESNDVISVRSSISLHIAIFSSISTL